MTAPAGDGGATPSGYRQRRQGPGAHPAASPLGTDAEASGAPPSPEMIAALRQAERAEQRSPLDPTDNQDDPRGLRPIGALALAVVLAGIVLWFSFA